MLTNASARPQMELAKQMSASEVLARVEELKAAANRRLGGGQVDAACAEYEKATRLLRLVDGDDDAVGGLRLALRLNSAACELKAGRHDAALGHSDAALALAPNSTKAMFRRGRSLEGLGRTDEAAAAYRAVLQHEPASREANTRLQALAARS